MFTLPELPFAYGALEPVIDTRTMQIHHDMHHAAYVNNLNDCLKDQPTLSSMEIEDLLKKLILVPESIRTKVRNNGGGHANHSLFWNILTPLKNQEPEGDLVRAINTTFGSLTLLQEKMNTAGMGRFGSGWVWLAVTQGKLEVMDTPNQDTPLMEHKTPVLGIDVWEHAYYLKYQNLRAEYLKAIWHVINWREVEKNYYSALVVST